MRIVCISASNTVAKGDKSASVMVCGKIKEIILREKPETTVEILPLQDYALVPCTLCGACCNTGKCPFDMAFNRVFTAIEQADGIFFVVPHYSPIPSKLMILFEKINEIVYANWLVRPEYRCAFRGTPVGVVGHGGMVGTEENLKYYHDHLVAPVANTLRSLSFQVTGVSDEYKSGAVFGLHDENCLAKAEHSVFPDIVQDWPTIVKSIEPLVQNVLGAVGAGKA